MKSMLMRQEQQGHTRLWYTDELPGTKLVYRRMLMMRSERWIQWFLPLLGQMFLSHKPQKTGQEK